MQVWICSTHTCRQADHRHMQVFQLIFTSFLLANICAFLHCRVCIYQLFGSPVFTMGCQDLFAKTWKPVETKTPVSQKFPILWPIPGGTMSKGTVRAFWKCVIYGGGDDLIHSYRLSKSVQIYINEFSVDRRRKKQAPKARGCASWTDAY